MLSPQQAQRQHILASSEQTLADKVSHWVPTLLQLLAQPATFADFIFGREGFHLAALDYCLAVRGMDAPALEQLFEAARRHNVNIIELKGTKICLQRAHDRREPFSQTTEPTGPTLSHYRTDAHSFTSLQFAEQAAQLDVPFAMPTSELRSLRERAETTANEDAWLATAKRAFAQLDRLTFEEFSAVFSPQAGPLGPACLSFLLATMLQRHPLSLLDAMCAYSGIDLWLLPGAWLHFPSSSTKVLWWSVGRKQQPAFWRKALASLAANHIWGGELQRRLLQPVLDHVLVEHMHDADSLSIFPEPCEPDMTLKRKVDMVFSVDYAFGPDRAFDVSFDFAEPWLGYGTESIDSDFGREQAARELVQILAVKVPDTRFRRAVHRIPLAMWDAVLAWSKIPARSLYALARRAKQHGQAHLIQLPGFFLATVRARIFGDREADSLLDIVRASHSPEHEASLANLRGPAFDHPATMRAVHHAQQFLYPYITVLTGLLALEPKNICMYDLDEPDLSRDLVARTSIVLESHSLTNLVDKPALFSVQSAVELLHDDARLDQLLQESELDANGFLLLARAFLLAQGRRITVLPNALKLLQLLFSRDLLSVEIVSKEFSLTHEEASTLLTPDVFLSRREPDLQQLNQNVMAMIDAPMYEQRVQPDMASDDEFVSVDLERVEFQEPPEEPAVKPIEEGMQRLFDPRHAECSVCYNECPSETPLWKCAHPICLSCVERLDSPKCPICRRQLQTIDLSAGLQIGLNFYGTE